MQVRLLEDAEKDLEGGYYFYERQSSGLGIYFLDSLFADIDSLAYFGGMHRIIFGHHRLLSRRFPFAVYYRVIDDSVVVTSVLDCRRRSSLVREKLRGKPGSE